MTGHVTAQLRAFASLVLVCLLAGCASEAPMDYTTFRQSAPRSILVLPPINESNDVAGTYSYLSTVTMPIAELGYYVFPVAVMTELFNQNGVTQATEIQQIPLAKLREITGADAVLYPVLHAYGSKYVIVDSVSIVSVSARLVDAKTGAILWQGSAKQELSANGKQNNSNNANPYSVAAQLIGALVSQVVNAKTDPSHHLAQQVNIDLIQSQQTGFIAGPYRLPAH